MAKREQQTVTIAADETAQASFEEKRERLRNNVRNLREDRLLSKAELGQKAGLSALTIDRVENGMPCRMNTKRKIILALGMKIEEKEKVFLSGDEDGSVIEESH